MVEEQPFNTGPYPWATSRLTDASLNPQTTLSNPSRDDTTPT